MTFQGVNDLNSGCPFRQSFRTFPGGTDVRWQARVRAGHGVRTLAHLSPVGREVSRRLQRAPLQLPGSVPVHGLRPADLPREPARHRGLPARASRPSSITWASAARVAQRPGRCQRDRATGASTPSSPMPDPHRASALCRGLALAVDLDETVYALDATTIDLCLSLFPWAPFRTTKAAMKLHTLLDLRGSDSRRFIHISDGKLHDVNVLDLLIAEPGAFYVMDRGYLDFERLYACIRPPASSSRAPSPTSNSKRVYSRPVDRSTGLICDQPSRCSSSSTPSRLSRDACVASAIAIRRRRWCF